MTAIDAHGGLTERADTRLSSEYHDRHRRLAQRARDRYGLSARDSVDVAHRTLIAWHDQLSTAGELGHDDLFCNTVLCFTALDRLRRLGLAQPIWLRPETEPD